MGRSEIVLRRLRMLRLEKDGLEKCDCFLSRLRRCLSPLLSLGRLELDATLALCGVRVLCSSSIHFFHLSIINTNKSIHPNPLACHSLVRPSLYACERGCGGDGARAPPTRGHSPDGRMARVAAVCVIPSLPSFQPKHHFIEANPSPHCLHLPTWKSSAHQPLP